MLASVTTYKCSKCHEDKDSSCFAPSQRRAGAWCRDCYRTWYRSRAGVVEAQRECSFCASTFTTTDKRKTHCSRACKDKARDAADKSARIESKPARSCLYCGVDMPQTMRADARYCSEDCNHKAHMLKRGHGRLPRGSGRRREILRAYIIQRDRSRCHLCGEHVPAEQIHLDHVVPLSLGGPHDESNLRVAHARCNLQKGNRPRNEQLLAVG